MKKIKESIQKFIKSFEQMQVTRAQRILANARAGLGRWE
jgi:hypothetical protein